MLKYLPEARAKVVRAIQPMSKKTVIGGIIDNHSGLAPLRRLERGPFVTARNASEGSSSIQQPVPRSLLRLNSVSYRRAASSSFFFFNSRLVATLVPRLTDVDLV